MLSERVRVASGDLCRLWAAEALTKPAGETVRLFEKSHLHLAKLSLCRSASIVTVILPPPKTATQPSHIVTLFISQTDFTPIVTAFVLIIYSILVKQTPSIDIQLHSQCICFHISTEKFNKLCRTAIPFGIFTCDFASDIFKQRFGRQLPQLAKQREPD